MDSSGNCRDPIRCVGLRILHEGRLPRKVVNRLSCWGYGGLQAQKLTSQWPNFIGVRYTESRILRNESRPPTLFYDILEASGFLQVVTHTLEMDREKRKGNVELFKCRPVERGNIPGLNLVDVRLISLIRKEGLPSSVQSRFIQRV